ncbi:MAG: hypothetical protein RL684_850 [Pseudomonadota bacterium]|jgi:hypothetical protein
MSSDAHEMTVEKAYALADEVTPAPARAHAALLVMRARCKELESACACVADEAKKYLDADDFWNDDEEPETSEASKSRNEKVRQWKRLDAAVASAKEKLSCE